MRKPKTTFNTAHKQWLKAQERDYAVRNSSEEMSERAFDRLISRRRTARASATENLAAARASNIGALAAKIEALWAVAISDFRTEAAAVRFGDLGEEEFELLKSIRRDAARLAKRG
jgi:hypothetical protein